MTDANTRLAIVTGAAKGIGAAVAERLARDGFAVVVNFASDGEGAREVVRRVEEAGGRAMAVEADVSDPNAVSALFDQGEAQFGSCSILVNNAGFMHLGPIAKMDDEAFDRLFAVNVKGVFNCMREGARRITGNGRIISLSSSANGAYIPTYGPYVATKAAVEGLSHVLSKELGARGISVNVVAPGPTATDLFLSGKSDEQVAAIAKMIPFGRIADASEIASVVSFLAGPDGGWVNGQVLRANGGMI